MYYVFVQLKQTHMNTIVYGFGIIWISIFMIIIGGLIWNATHFGRFRRIIPYFGLIMALSAFYFSLCGIDMVDPTFFPRQFDGNLYNIFL